MSYILEALKKAQAERQLGNAPTIHAPPPQPAVAVAQAGPRRVLLAGVAAGVAVALVACLVAWRALSGPGSVAVAAPHGVPAAGVPAAGAPAAGAAVESARAAGAAAGGTPAAEAPAVSRAAPQGAQQGGAVDGLAVRAPAQPVPRTADAAPQRNDPAPASLPGVAPAGAPAAAPRMAAPVAVADSRAVGSPAAGSPAAAAQAQAQATATATATASAPARAPVPVPAPEDSLPWLQQLPEAIQRDVPRVSFGGYMYSANPADRLLLVDKALRHEGEEVAPGLVLEKLLPKAAVMNFRGVRYRVAY